MPQTGIGFRILAVIAVLIVAASNAASQDVHIAVSPNGRVKISLFQKEIPRNNKTDPILYYRVEYDNQPVIDDSELGLRWRMCLYAGIDGKRRTLDEIETLEGKWIANVKTREVEEAYDLVCGKRRSVRSVGEEIVASLRTYGLRVGVKPDEDMFRGAMVGEQGAAVVLRAFNDGVSFRYELLGPRTMRRSFVPLITEERTRFRFPPGAEGWLLNLKSFDTPYEANYRRVPLAEVGSDALIGLPLLVRIGENIWAAVMEAEFQGEDPTPFCGLYLAADPESPGALAARLPPSPRTPEGSITAVKGIYRSPWRVVLLADNPGMMIESDLVTSLSPPQHPIFNKVGTDWIRPGKAVWPWWSGRTTAGTTIEGGMNTATMLHYLDFAAANRLEYLLIDSGWYGPHDDPSANITKPIEALDLPLVLARAQESGVGVLLWLNWKCLEDEQRMIQAFRIYDQWGVAGIKVDYMNRDDEEMTTFYRRVVAEAARHRLLVDFHGVFKPTGLRREFPNLITREAVLGQEYCKWNRRCDPEHVVTIPYTRLPAGPMDFTPGCFRTRNREEFRPENPPTVMGTRCQQLAMFVVYESPLQVLPDYPQSYSLGTGLQFLKDVPASWDDTRFLQGEPGNFIVLARRSGREWYLGGLTDWEPRTVDVSLDFLGGGKWTMHLYTDPAGEDADLSDAEFQLRPVTSGADILSLRMASGGGFAARLTRD